MARDKPHQHTTRPRCFCSSSSLRLPVRYAVDTWPEDAFKLYTDDPAQPLANPSRTLRVRSETASINTE